MNEELEQLIQEIKSLLPWLLAAGIVVAGYHGVRKYVANKRAAASEAVDYAKLLIDADEARDSFTMRERTEVQDSVQRKITDYQQKNKSRMKFMKIIRIKY
jgi:hypothetical protein